MKWESDVNPNPHTGSPCTLTLPLHSHLSREPRGAFVLLSGWALWRSLSLNDLCFQRRVDSACLSGPDSCSFTSFLQRQSWFWNPECKAAPYITRKGKNDGNHLHTMQLSPKSLVLAKDTQMLTRLFNIPFQNLTCQPHSVFSWLLLDVISWVIFNQIMSCVFL